MIYCIKFDTIYACPNYILPIQMPGGRVNDH